MTGVVEDAGNFLRAAETGRWRSREPEEGPGSERVTTTPMSSMSLGVRKGEEAWWKGLLVAWRVSMRGRFGHLPSGKRATSCGQVGGLGATTVELS